VEFTFLEGFYEVGRPDFEPFKKRGFKGPFRKWGDYDAYDLFSDPYREGKWDIPKTEEFFMGIEASITYIVKYLEQSKTKFDGFCGFSQGCVTIATLFTAQQYF